MSQIIDRDMERIPTALITGASKGIGRAIALELARGGFDIIGVGRSYNPAGTNSAWRSLQEDIEKLGRTCSPIQADIANISDHDRIIEGALAAGKEIDTLVNNAGVAPLQRLDILETTPESFDRVIGVNARGPFFLTQSIARLMAQQSARNPGVRQSIVFITSVSAYMSSTNRAEYCVSKAALSSMSTLFADGLARYGINVYEVRPGIIATDMTAAVREKYDRLIAEGLIPQQRWGVPEDIGKAVAALVSGDFAYSTGAIVEASGGMQIQRL